MSGDLPSITVSVLVIVGRTTAYYFVDSARKAGCWQHGPCLIFLSALQTSSAAASRSVSGAPFEDFIRRTLTLVRISILRRTHACEDARNGCVITTFAAAKCSQPRSSSLLPSHEAERPSKPLHRQGAPPDHDCTHSTAMLRNASSVRREAAFGDAGAMKTLRIAERLPICCGERPGASSLSDHPHAHRPPTLAPADCDLCTKISLSVPQSCHVHGLGGLSQVCRCISGTVVFLADRRFNVSQIIIIIMICTLGRGEGVGGVRPVVLHDADVATAPGDVTSHDSIYPLSSFKTPKMVGARTVSDVLERTPPIVIVDTDDGSQRLRHH
jgi:hypothetical protein